MSETQEEVVETSEPVEEAEPSWSGPSQEEWQQTQQALGYIAQQLQPQQQGPTLDPFADDYQQQLDAYIDQRLAPQVRPLQAWQYEQAMSAAEQQAQNLIKGYAAEDPFLLEDSASKARTLANDYLPQAQQRYGFGPRAAQEALKQAHKAVREWEDKVVEAGQARQSQHMGNLTSARREPQQPGSNAVASQMIGESGPGDERSIVLKYFGGKS